MPAASAHVLVEPRQDCHAVRADLEELLSRDYGITHLTLQVDHLPDPAATAVVPDVPRSHGSSEPRVAEDHHGTGESHQLHCEDSHGPVYRPAHDR
jgi:cobalt-zinc-cadmium efflux system protein